MGILITRERESIEIKDKPLIVRKRFYKLLFLDLNDTIRKPKSLGKFIQSPFDQEPIPGAKEMIASYKEKRWIIIGVTNQGGVEVGHKTIEECIAEQRQALKLFPEWLEIGKRTRDAQLGLGLILCGLKTGGRDCERMPMIVLPTPEQLLNQGEMTLSDYTIFCA